jgi:hypothetical protein
MNQEISNALDGRETRRVLAWIWNKLLVGAMIVGAAAGLTLVAVQPTKRSGEAARPAAPGSGVTVRIDLAHIWVPAQLYELARREAKNPKLMSEEELKAELKKIGGEGLWYALTLQLHQEDGGMSEITTVDYPFHSNRELPSFLDLVDTIGSKRQDHAESNSSTPVLHVIPDDLMQRPAREAVMELFKRYRDGM